MTILVIVRAYDEIAILVVTCAVTILTSKCFSLLDYGRAWNAELQLTELFKERSAEIIGFAVSERIPRVAAITTKAVYRERGFRRIHCNDAPSAEVAASFIEVSLVRKRDPPLESARRTECRRGNANLFIESEIFGLNSE